MSRDHYKGVPKKRVALLAADGDLEALAKGGEERLILGSVTLPGGSSNFVTVSGSGIKATSVALVSPQFAGSTDVNWTAAAGTMTISGTNAGVVAYQIIV